MSLCFFLVEAVFDLCWRMCPLSVAVERGRWFLISVGVRPVMVISVADGREHLVDVTGIIGCRRCGINVDGNGHGWFGIWVCMFA